MRLAATAIGGLLARRELSGSNGSMPVEYPACTPEQEADLSRLWDLKASPASACDPYFVRLNDSSMIISVSCSSTECLSELETMAKTVPPCSSYGNVESAQEQVQSLFVDCENGKEVLTPYQPHGLGPATPVCTDAQLKESAAAFVKVSQLKECKDYTIAHSQYVGVFAPCHDPCAAKASEVLGSLPDCYNELDAENKKKRATEVWKSCVDAEVSMPYYNFFRAESIAGLDNGKGSAQPSAPESESVKTLGSNSAAGRDARVVLVAMLFAVIFAMA